MLAKKREQILLLILILLAVLVGFRIYLPTLVKNYVNQTLQKIPGYGGHIESVDLHLWRGAYTIRSLELHKLEGKIPVPYFQASRIDLAVHWKPLLHGQFVGQILLDHPTLNFVAADSPDQQQTSIDSSWQDRVQDLMPLRISRVQIHQGEVHFRQLQADPPVDVFVRNIEATASNLTNSKKVSTTLKAAVDIQAMVMDSGWVIAHAEVDPFAARPTFRTQFKMERLQLPSLNTFFKHYLAIEAHSGVLNFYFEGTAHEGQFDGYMKPLLDHLDVIHIKEGATIGEFFKGLAVKMVSYTFKNHPADRLGTRVPIQGTIESPTPDTWAAIGSFLKNWFIKALRPGFDRAK